MQNFQRITVLFFLIASSFNGKAQNEFSKWYFGFNGGLDFSTQPPTVLSNGGLNALEGVATISDAAGNLLFYMDSYQIFNSTYTNMANGTGILGDGSSTQASMIVKQPGNNSIYYVFTTKAGSFFRYSIVDMTMAAGLGSVTVKNATLYAPTCEKQVVVRHCNGTDAWILSHHYGSNEFRAYLLTSTGLSANPVVSAIGESSAGPGDGAFSAIGQLKISPDGKKLAVASLSNSIPTSLGMGGFFLFDFDAATGIVSNSLTLLSGANLTMGAGAYGVEFSPDGTKLYGSTIPATSPVYTCTLHQWNICAPNSAAIITSQYSITLNDAVGSMQRAIDGKIYVAIALSSSSLGIINTPNASGAAMNFAPYGISVAPGMSQLGLPNYINMYTRTLPSPFTNTVACQTVSFSVPPVPTFSSGCTSTPYPPNNYLWDFGEPAAGAANSSTLTNPIHTYSLMGTYSVSLILYSNCTNDTLRKIVTITTPGPTLSVSGNSLICKGAKTIYTVSGGSSYQWSNNTTATTATFAPSTNTVYSVTASLNGCSQSKTFSVTVSPCTGIADYDNTTLFHVFPNPIKENLSIDAQVPSNVLFFDMNGTLVLESKIATGKNDINTTGLKPGVYSLHIEDGNSVLRMRLVKME